MSPHRLLAAHDNILDEAYEVVASEAAANVWHLAMY
jgi:hypothetical protein